MKRVFRILAIAAIIFAAMQFGIWIDKALAASVPFTWPAVTTNCDLSTANDIAGYVILWGTTQGGPYPNEHIVTTPSTSTLVDVGDQDGVDLYFVAVTYDIDGNRTDDPGGCGTSPEVAVNFPTKIPTFPSLAAGAVVP